MHRKTKKKKFLPCNIRVCERDKELDREWEKEKKKMTTEGRDMAEDVAGMTDDVPEQPTEAPEMRADAQGADSGEGSDGDDAAEGFPGGPRDPSVLTSFAEHVAHAVWSGQVF